MAMVFFTLAVMAFAMPLAMTAMMLLPFLMMVAASASMTTAMAAVVFLLRRHKVPPVSEPAPG
ncbi:MAG: hypothetical protein J5519_00005, partial [Bacteroidales bacterium]|nr:hypothetical protein [Bacteroidales bacterium]